MKRNQRRTRHRRTRPARPRPSSISTYLAQVRRLIAQHGHAVQVVAPSPGEAGWAYTVGLHSHGLPELIVVGGLAVPDQHGILNELAERMRDGEVFEPGRRYPSLLVGFDVTFVEVADTTTEDFAVANRLQSDFRALQMVWPDHSNRFPWDPDYAIPKDDQRLLGLPPCSF